MTLENTTGFSENKETILRAKKFSLDVGENTVNILINFNNGKRSHEIYQND